MEFEQLINAPGMKVLLTGAPIFGVMLWAWLTTVLWRGGFNDLIERLTRPRWKGTERAHAAMMIPLRAVLLAGVAAFGAAMTTLGLLFNLAVIMNLIEAVRNGGA